MSALALGMLAAAAVVLPPGTAAYRLSAIAPRGSERTLPGARLFGRWHGRSHGDPRSARVVDLVAACLGSGLPVVAALDAVADAMDHHGATGASGSGDTTRAGGDPGPAGVLRAVAGRMRLGADAVQAWRDAPEHPAVSTLAEVLRRSDGSRSGPALAHAAQRIRDEETAAALTRAEKAGVLVAGPLGLCFLPAFVCLGVVPVVVGLAGDVLPAVRG